MECELSFLLIVQLYHRQREPPQVWFVFRNRTCCVVASGLALPIARRKKCNWRFLYGNPLLSAEQALQEDPDLGTDANVQEGMEEGSHENGLSFHPLPRFSLGPCVAGWAGTVWDQSQLLQA